MSRTIPFRGRAFASDLPGRPFQVVSRPFLKRRDPDVADALVVDLRLDAADLDGAAGHLDLLRLGHPLAQDVDRHLRILGSSELLTASMIVMSFVGFPSIRTI